MTRTFYAGAHGIVVVFDITKRATFDMISGWLKSIEESAPQDVCIILVGNKVDLETERAVTRAEAEAFATLYNLGGYFETSAKENIGVTEAFEALSKRVLHCWKGRLEVVTEKVDLSKKSVPPPKCESC